MPSQYPHQRPFWILGPAVDFHNLRESRTSVQIVIYGGAIWLTGCITNNSQLCWFFIPPNGCIVRLLMDSSCFSSFQLSDIFHNSTLNLLLENGIVFKKYVLIFFNWFFSHFRLVSLLSGRTGRLFFQGTCTSYLPRRNEIVLVNWL